MIVANVRYQITRSDAQMAVTLLGRESAQARREAEDKLRDEGIDSLLDDPSLLPLLLDSRQGMHASYPMFTYVVVRNALINLGESDRVLADYVASILMHFGLRDNATRISEADDQVYTTLADLGADLENADARRSFLVRTHMGNLALWYSGIFPDYIESRRYRKGGPNLDYYDELGKRGFTLAAGHRLAHEYGMMGLYETAAQQFPLLRAALNDVSDMLVFPNVNSADRLMRQVSATARWKRVH